MISSVNSTTIEDVCAYVNEIDKSSLQCEWVKNTRDCFASGGARIDYASFIFCDMTDFPSGKLFGMLILCVWLGMLFIVLATIADKFFCPALTVVAKLFHLSESMAGVTILAFGNGSPDIFTSLAGLSSGHGALIFSQMIGGGMFVTSAVVGLICILYPFELNGMDFLRDCICLLIAFCWTYYVFHTGRIGVSETIGFVVLYAVYVVIVIFTRTIKKRKTLNEMTPARSRPKTVTIVESLNIIRTQDVSHGEDPLSEINLSAQSENFNLKSIDSIEKHLEDRQIAPWDSLDLEDESALSLDVRAEMLRLMASPPFRITSTQANAMLDLALQAELMMKLSMMNENDLIKTELKKRKTKEILDAYKRPGGLFESFLLEMSPFTIHAWGQKSWYKKILTITQVPITLLLKLLIPVVNLTSINHGWCKLLNTINCVSLPLCMLLSFGVVMSKIFWIVVFCGFCLGLSVFLTSQSATVPRYHELFSILGFIGSMWIIYLVANEIVGILRTIGVVLKISEAILGLTILAWGNSLGDMIANLTIAQAGFQKMGFAACFGGPLFGILLGLGISSICGLLKENQSFTVSDGEFGTLSMLFLLMSLMSSLIILPIVKFRVGRVYGFYLLLVYSVFITIAALEEANAIPKIKI